MSDDPQQQLSVALRFNELRDFEPDRVAEQVPELDQLMQARERLRSLLSQLDGNVKLEDSLERIMTDHRARALIQSQLDD